MKTWGTEFHNHLVKCPAIYRGVGVSCSHLKSNHPGGNPSQTKFSHQLNTVYNFTIKECLENHLGIHLKRQYPSAVDKGISLWFFSRVIRFHFCDGNKFSLKHVSEVYDHSQHILSDLPVQEHTMYTLLVRPLTSEQSTKAYKVSRGRTGTSTWIFHLCPWATCQLSGVGSHPVALGSAAHQMVVAGSQQRARLTASETYTW